MAIQGSKAILSFDYADGLTTSDGKTPAEFAIADSNRIWHWADARIENERTIVWSSRVKNPVAVRYTWANNPHRANLTNAVGLPAFSFRSDSWPGVTDDER